MAMGAVLHAQAYKNNLGEGISEQSPLVGVQI